MLKQFYKITLGLLVGLIASANLLALTPRENKHIASLQMQAKDVKAAVKALEKRPSAFNDPENLQALVDGVSAMEEEICWVKDNCDHSAKARRVVDQACDVRAYYNSVVQNPRVQELAENLGVDLLPSSNGSLLKQAVVGAAVCSAVCGGGYLAWQAWQEHKAKPYVAPVAPIAPGAPAPGAGAPVVAAPYVPVVSAALNPYCYYQYQILMGKVNGLNVISNRANNAYTLLNVQSSTPSFGENQTVKFNSKDAGKYVRAIADYKCLEKLAAELGVLSEKLFNDPQYLQLKPYSEHCFWLAQHCRRMADVRRKQCENGLRRNCSFFEKWFHGVSS